MSQLVKSSLQSGWEVLSAPRATRLDRNYFIYIGGNTVIVASALALHDGDYRASIATASAFARSIHASEGVASWKRGAEFSAQAARAALSVEQNAKGVGDRPVEGLSFTVLWCSPGRRMTIVNLGSNVVVSCRGGRVEDLIEPQPPVPYGTRIALPEETCTEAVSGTSLIVPADMTVIVAPPSSVKRPFVLGGDADPVAVVERLGRPYRQYPTAFAAVQ